MTLKNKFRLMRKIRHPGRMLKDKEGCSLEIIAVEKPVIVTVPYYGNKPRFYDLAEQHNMHSVDYQIINGTQRRKCLL